MSHQLYSSDNMSVTGHSYKAPSENSTEKLDAIHLDFTLQINWRLKSFGYSFLVIPSETTSDPNVWDTEWKNTHWDMVEWQSWNMMYYIFTNLWYTFNWLESNPNPAQYAFRHDIAVSWIQTIMNNQ